VQRLRHEPAWIPPSFDIGRNRFKCFFFKANRNFTLLVKRATSRTLLTCDASRRRAQKKEAPPKRGLSQPNDRDLPLLVLLVTLATLARLVLLLLAGLLVALLLLVRVGVLARV
jgi:hypothetical protein